MKGTITEIHPRSAHYDNRHRYIGRMCSYSDKLMRPVPDLGPDWKNGQLSVQGIGKRGRFGYLYVFGVRIKPYPKEASK